MTAPENPRRLKNDPELGPLLRSLEGDALSAERLAASREAVVAAAAAAGAGGLSVAALWKWLAVIAAIGVGGYALLRSPPAPAPAPAPDTTAAVVRLDAGIPVVSDAAVPALALDAALAPADAAPRAGARRRLATAVPRDAAAPAPAPDAAPPPASSSLPEQLALFRASQSAAAAGRYDEAVAGIDELLRRFPASPVRADAELGKAEFLVRAGRRRQAIALIERLVTRAPHRGRRGELFRVLGDQHRQGGDCERAAAAYRQAVALATTRRERGAARRGLERCLQP